MSSGLTPRALLRMQIYRDVKKSLCLNAIYDTMVLLNFFCCFTPVLEGLLRFLRLGLDEPLIPFPGTNIALRQFILLLLWPLDLMVWLTLLNALNGTILLFSAINLLLATCHLLFFACELSVYFVWTGIQLPLQLVFAVLCI